MKVQKRVLELKFGNSIKLIQQHVGSWLLWFTIDNRHLFILASLLRTILVPLVGVSGIEILT